MCVCVCVCVCGCRSLFRHESRIPSSYNLCVVYRATFINTLWRAGDATSTAARVRAVVARDLGHLSFLASSSVSSHSRFQCFSSCFVSSILSVLSSATPRARQGWVDERAGAYAGRPCAGGPEYSSAGGGRSARFLVPFSSVRGCERLTYVPGGLATLDQLEEFALRARAEDGGRGSEVVGGEAAWGTVAGSC